MTFSNTHLRTWWLGLLPSAQDDVKGVLSAHDLHALDQAFTDNAEDAHAAGRGDVAQLEAERESLRQQLVREAASPLPLRTETACLLCGWSGEDPTVACCVSVSSASSLRVKVPLGWAGSDHFRAVSEAWLEWMLVSPEIAVVRAARARQCIAADGSREATF